MLNSNQITLKNGDRLSREEFEYRYEQCPHIKKAELINGVVFVASPIRVKKHAQPHGYVIVWLGTYASFIDNIMVCDNATVRLDDKNEVQPDVLLRLEESAGGQSRISDDDYIEGAPELVIEIAASSADYDLSVKKELYSRYGVKEYLVWVVPEEKFYWFYLGNQTYIQQVPNNEGILQSREFIGLWLNLPALFRGDIKAVMHTLQAGLAFREQMK